MWSRGVFYDVKHCGLQSRLHGSPLLRKGKVWKVWWVSPQVKLETKAGPTSGLCTKTKCSLRGEKRGWGESDGNAVWCIHGWEFEVDEFSWSSHKITKKGGNMDKTRNISCLCTILPRVTWGCFFLHTLGKNLGKGKRFYLNPCLWHGGWRPPWILNRFQAHHIPSLSHGPPDYPRVLQSFNIHSVFTFSPL